MQPDWTRTTWGELASLEYGKALRGYQDAQAPFPVFGTNGPIGWHSEALCDTAGVIIGRKGAYRGVHYSATPFYVIDTAFYLKPKVDLDLRWAYYQLLSIDLNSMDSGSAIPSTSRDEFYKLPVWFPSRQEQTHIADTLEAFDRRIDLLRQTNATLESIAQALFKSWFIDFDSVRAKAEGREPDGMDAETAVLFPDEFEESELGLIPKGWRTGTLGDACTNPRVQAKPGQMPLDTPHIGLEHMPRKSIALDSAGIAEGLESGKFWFERDDVLFGKLRPYFHKVGLAPFRGVCSTDILVLRPKESEWLGFVAMHASSDALVSYTTQLSNGARMPRTSWHDVAGFDVVLPTQAAVNAFDRVVRPMFERIYANIELARTLSGTRDTLLPRLVSGKLRLTEAQEEAATI